MEAWFRRCPSGEHDERWSDGGSAVPQGSRAAGQEHHLADATGRQLLPQTKRKNQSARLSLFVCLSLSPPLSLSLTLLLLFLSFVWVFYLTT